MLWLCLTLLLVPAADEGQRVLVQPLRRHDVPEAEARWIEEALADELGRRAALRIVTARDIGELAQLQRDGLVLDCVDEVCVAELSRAARAHFVLSGSVGKVGERLVLTLGLMDASRNASAGSEAAVGADARQVIAELPQVVAALFGAATERSAYRLAGGEPVSFAVFDLEAAGVSADTAMNLTQILATQLKQIERVSVISRADIASVLTLEVEKDRLDCGADGTCLAEIGAALGVQKLVVGSVGRLADSFVVTLRLIDVRGVRVDSRVTEVFSGPDEQLIPATRYAARRLIGVEATTPGTLAVSAATAGASVFVDDAERGVLPMPAIGPLTPGRHRLRLLADGFEPWSADVYVEPAASSSLWAELTELPRPWYQRWWVWAGAAVLVAGGTTAALLLRAEPEGRPVSAFATELPR